MRRLVRKTWAMSNETDNSRQKTVDDRTVGNKAIKCRSGPNTPVSKQLPPERFPDISEEGKLTKYRPHECAYCGKVCISGETTARDVKEKVTLQQELPEGKVVGFLVYAQ
ncbi:hypothetical protein M404DRAFT_839164 [Pisolithus tinctorius Marx 270]|uniref:Uncharacterized protein n=1 Tax=Pisolithus tinctorius Marx 270 TaxID=870435 RepID=A0A0C3PRN0_PISTI|nr:hypothetical protein M404DRAFT_839164 [Pisolithus tinctorius Marx 270]